MALEQPAQPIEGVSRENLVAEPAEHIGVLQARQVGPFRGRQRLHAFADEGGVPTLCVHTGFPWGKLSPEHELQILLDLVHSHASCAATRIDRACLVCDLLPAPPTQPFALFDDRAPVVPALL
jgi:hypothetical protein